MKKLLFVCCILASVSIFACECEDKKFTTTDLYNVITTFVITNLGIENQNIKVIDIFESEIYTPIQHDILRTFIGSSTCSGDCLRVMSEKYSVELAYLRGSLACTRNIELKMASNLFSKGFTYEIQTVKSEACL